MRLFAILFAFSLTGSALAMFDPSLKDWLLLTLPCAIASALAWAKLWRQRRGPKKNRVIVDGSNVMHWDDNTAKTETLQEVIAALTQAGFTPGIMFDANAGYKLTGRYLHDGDFAALFGLPQDQIMVAPKGTPADPMILTAARDYGTRVVSNDQFRDWVDEFEDVLRAKQPIRGGYKNGKLWLSL